MRRSSPKTSTERAIAGKRSVGRRPCFVPVAREAQDSWPRTADFETVTALLILSVGIALLGLIEIFGY
jgi:hypothetical protein